MYPSQPIPYSYQLPGGDYMESRYLTAAEGQKYLKISRATFSKLLHDPTFPQTRIGKRILIAKDKLDAWMDARTRNA